MHRLCVTLVLTPRARRSLAARCFIALVAAASVVLGAYAQSPGTRIAGMLERWRADALDGTSRDIWQLLLQNGGRVELQMSPGRMPRSARPGQAAVATGIRTGENAFEVQDIAIQEEAGGARKSAMVSAPGATTSVLAILVKFSDSDPDPLKPFSQSDTIGSMFMDAQSVASYFAENSYGTAAITGDVTPWLVAGIPTPQPTDADPCPTATIQSIARQLASAAGYTLSNYQRTAYIFPTLHGCNWAGLANLPGQNLWINGSNYGGLISHELGHTFGLDHANLLLCDGGRSAIGGVCSATNQGDFLDTMGFASLWHHFDAPHKYSLGFLPNGTVVAHSAGSGTYTLSPLETPNGSLYAIRIPANAERTYWVEYRRPIGFDTPLGFEHPLPFDGAVVHISTPNDYNCSDTCFIDSTLAASPDRDEVPALSPGHSYVDRASGVSIDVLSQDSSGLTVRVEKSNVAMLRDIDNDGNADLLWSDVVSHTASMWLLKAGATSQAGYFTMPNGWQPEATGDFDGDGKADIVWRNSTSGTAAIWFLSGSISAGAMIANTAFFGVDPAWSIVGIGDFDGDGRGDLLWRHGDGRMTAWLMDGSQIRASVVLPSVDANWALVGTGDFFGDRKSEVVWRHMPTGSVFLWENVSSSVRLVSLGNPGTTWTLAGIGDFNGDGVSDLFWRDDAGEDAIWPAGTPVGATFLPGVGTEWTPIGIRAIYGDGADNLLWRRSDGLIAAWRFDRDLNVTASFLTSAPLNWDLVR